MDRLLTIDEVAAHYGIHRSTLYEWQKHLGFPQAMKIGGRCFFKKQWIEEFELRQMVKKGRRTTTFSGQ